MRTSVLVLACCILGACGVSSTPPTGSASSAPADVEHWKLSNECSDAAARFWKMAGYHDGEEHVSYTNHFNKSSGTCLIRIRSTTMEKDGPYEEDQIFDAVEHVERMRLIQFNYPNGRSLYSIDGKTPVPADADDRSRMDRMMTQ